MENSKSHPVNFADCYVLTNKRTKAFLTSFLDAFLPHRQEATSRYTIPQFSDEPTFIFNSDETLIDYLVHHPNEPHAIYWLNKDVSTLRGAMCIFTNDGNVILGLYCETLRPDTHIEREYLKKLLDFCESADGLIEYEQPAPEDTDVFQQRLNDFKSNMSI